MTKMLLLFGFFQENIILSFVLTITAYIVFLVGYELMRNRPDKIPEKYPFENTMKIIMNYDTINDFFYDEFKRNPETYAVNIFGLPWLISTTNVANITHVLKNVDTYGKGPEFSRHFRDLLGDGIFNSDGTIWYKHRKTSLQLFNLSTFKNSVLDTFNKHGDDVVRIIHSKDGKAFDIQAIFFRFTLESIGEIALGKSLGLLHQESVPFADAFDYCQSISNDSLYDPLGLLKRYTTPAGFRFFRSIKVIDDFAYKIVRERRNDYRLDKANQRTDETDSPDHAKNDILSLYLQRESVGDGEELTDKMLRDVVLSFIIAGRDTTANALSWSMFRLCEETHRQDRIVEEIKEVMRKNGQDCTADGFRWSYEVLHGLKYLDAFVMEVLRLHPSIPREGKYALKDDVLPDGTVVTKGMLVVFNPYVMGRSDKLWGPDCLQFKPERFLNAPKPSPFVFTAFQAGPRICLGQSLAMLELKYMLAKLLVSFKFNLMQGVKSVTYQTTVSLPVKGALSVAATPRVL